MARQPVMQLSPGFYAANVSVNGQPFLLPATFRPVSCGLCRRDHDLPPPLLLGARVVGSSTR